MTKPTPRAMATALRTYHRPVKEGRLCLNPGTRLLIGSFAISAGLWERALCRFLNEREDDELEEMRRLITNRYIAPAGRTLWLGGTELSRMRESSMFNCSYHTCGNCL